MYCACHHVTLFGYSALPSPFSMGVLVGDIFPASTTHLAPDQPKTETKLRCLSFSQSLFLSALDSSLSFRFSSCRQHRGDFGSVQAQTHSLLTLSWVSKTYFSVKAFASAARIALLSGHSKKRANSTFQSASSPLLHQLTEHSVKYWPSAQVIAPRCMGLRMLANFTDGAFLNPKGYRY